LNKRTMIILRVNEQAERFYDKSKELGTLAARSFFEERDRQRHRAQMTGLENIAETTLKATDVLDYIKKQIARQEGWRKEYDGKRFGESLKTYIENNLRRDVTSVCASVGIGDETDEDKRQRQYIYLQLIRQLIRQVVVQYEYHISQQLERPRHDH